MLLKQNSALLAIFSKNSFGINSILGVFGIGLALSMFLTVTKFTILNSQRQEATLSLIFEDGELSRMFEGEVIEGMTILQALVASTGAGKVKLEYSIDPENKVTIKALNGYAKMLDRKMVFYLNNLKINSEDINRVVIQGGDRIEIRPDVVNY